MFPKKLLNSLEFKLKLNCRSSCEGIPHSVDDVDEGKCCERENVGNSLSRIFRESVARARTVSSLRRTERMRHNRNDLRSDSSVLSARLHLA